MIRIAHFSDLHYCGKHLEWVDLAMTAAVDKATTEECDVAVLSGDSFDSAIDLHHPAVGRLIERIRELAACMPVFILQGTFSHDRPGCLDVFRHIDTVFPVHVSEQREMVALVNGNWTTNHDKFDRAKLVISAYPSINRAEIQATTPDVGTASYVDEHMQEWAPINAMLRERGIPTMLVTHGTINGCVTESKQAMVSQDHEFSAASLFSAETDAVAIGHIHAHQAWEYSDSIVRSGYSMPRARRIAYPGSITRLIYGHDSPTGMLLWKLEPGAATFELFETPNRRLIDIEFEGPPDMAELDLRLVSCKGAWVRLRYSVDEEHRKSIDSDGIKQLLEAAGLASYKVEARINPIQRTRSAGISSESSTEVRLKRWCELTASNVEPLLSRLAQLAHVDAASSVAVDHDGSAGMKPLWLRLKNFRGIRSGLNRDELTLDLNDCHGLVAVIGPNGYGKTTILDNLHPYRVMPFRATGNTPYSERNTSYYDETYDEAEKELVWEHCGRTFRCLIKINNTNKTGTTKSYLFEKHGDAWAPYVGPDGTIADGKSETYDRCVRSLIGEPEMFFTAIFAAQNRKRLADYPAGDIKKLMSDLLNLDHLLDLSKAAGDRGRLVQTEIERMQPELRAFDQAKADLETQQQLIASTEQSIGDTEGDRSAQQQGMDEANRKLGEARVREQARDETRRRRESLTQQAQKAATDIATHRQTIQTNQTSITAFEAGLVAQQSMVETAFHKLGEAKAHETNRAETSRRRTALNQQVVDIEADIARAQNQLKRDRQAAIEQGVAADVVHDIATLTARASTLKTRLQQAESASAAAYDADAAELALAKAKQDLEEADEAIQVASTKLDGLADAPLKLSELRQQRESKVQAGLVEKQQFDAATERAALVKRVPCAGMEIAGQCELLADARKASTTAAEHEASLTARRAELETISAELGTLRQRDEEHTKTKAELDQLRKNRREVLEPLLSSAQTRVSAASAGLEVRKSIETLRIDVSQSEQELSDKQQLAEARRTESAARVTEIDADFATQDNARRQRLTTARAELEALPIASDADSLATATAALETAQAAARATEQALTTARTNLASAQASLAAAEERSTTANADLLTLPPEPTTNEVADASAAVTAAQEAIRTTDRLLAMARSNLATAQAALQSAEERVAAGQEAADNLVLMTEDLAQWRLLSRALGRDGIVALAIDDAGPSISSIANDLLMECYGPRFSIRFDTQSETAKGTLKEDFDIVVFDAERGDEKSATKTSGGERVWINDAITRAVALVQARQAGNKFSTLFSDESDTGLDADRKVHSFRMKKRVLQIGGYETEFCITHSRELWEMADRVIDVAKFRVN